MNSWRHRAHKNCNAWLEKCLRWLSEMINQMKGYQWVFEVVLVLLNSVHKNITLFRTSGSMPAPQQKYIQEGISGLIEVPELLKQVLAHNETLQTRRLYEETMKMMDNHKVLLQVINSVPFGRFGRTVALSKFPANCFRWWLWPCELPTLQWLAWHFSRGRC